MKPLKYYIYQLLQKIKSKKKIFLLFLIVFLILFLIPEKKKVNFLLIEIDGTISSEKFDFDKMIDEIKNPLYDGIILKISSEGGTLETIRLINILKNINKTKICYINGIATSAAYWICSLSDYIIARSDSIVGNIGVYFVLTDLSDFLKKIGINITVIKGTPYKDIGSPYRKISEFEKEYIEKLVKNITNEFINDVKKRRENIKEIALSGLWFISYDAKEVGLIDKIGEFDEVKKYISKKYNIDERDIRIIKKSFEIRKFSIFEILKNIYGCILDSYKIYIKILLNIFYNE